MSILTTTGPPNSSPPTSSPPTTASFLTTTTTEDYVNNATDTVEHTITEMTAFSMSGLVAIVLGVVAVIAIVVGIVVCCMLKRRNDALKKATTNGAGPTQTNGLDNTTALPPNNTAPTTVSNAQGASVVNVTSNETADPDGGTRVVLNESAPAGTPSSSVPPAAVSVPPAPQPIANPTILNAPGPIVPQQSIPLYPALPGANPASQLLLGPSVANTPQLLNTTTYGGPPYQAGAPVMAPYMPQAPQSYSLSGPTTASPGVGFTVVPAPNRTQAYMM